MSFNIATSGLKSITQQLEAISNNIANSGTTGYKSMRAEFASLYADRAPLGVGVSNVSQSISRGGNITETGRNLDLAISGNGFFVVRDINGKQIYTRAGYFGTDAQGNLVNNQGGKLQGYQADANGKLQPGRIGDLNINANGLPAKATTELKFNANLDAREKPIPSDKPFDPDDSETYNKSYTTQVFDSLGREHTVTQYFVKTSENEWTAHYVVDGDKSNATSQDMKFDTNGKLVSPTGNVTISAVVAGAAPLDISLSYEGTSQFAADFAVSKNEPNGYKPGEKIGQQIDEDGSVYATYSNGQRQLQGQLVLASFTNPDGLKAIDGTAWEQGNSSGMPLLGAAKSGTNGLIKSAALESSNVDLTNELVGLMSAQRNYQANTKVISTNDQMMSALFQAV